MLTADNYFLTLGVCLPVRSFVCLLVWQVGRGRGPIAGHMGYRLPMRVPYYAFVFLHNAYRFIDAV